MQLNLFIYLIKKKLTDSLNWHLPRGRGRGRVGVKPVIGVIAVVLIRVRHNRPVDNARPGGTRGSQARGGIEIVRCGG